MSLDKLYCKECGIDHCVHQTMVEIKENMEQSLAASNAREIGYREAVELSLELIREMRGYFKDGWQEIKWGKSWDEDIAKINQALLDGMVGK